MTKNSKGESITVPVPKGTYLTINTPGLHYNRQFCSPSPLFPFFSDVLVTDMVGFSQPGTGKTLTNLIHLGFLVIGRGMRFIHSVVVSTPPLEVTLFSHAFCGLKDLVRVLAGGRFRSPLCAKKKHSPNLPYTDLRKRRRWQCCLVLYCGIRWQWPRNLSLRVRRLSKGRKGCCTQRISLLWREFFFAWIFWTDWILVLALFGYLWRLLVGYSVVVVVSTDCIFAIHVSSVIHKIHPWSLRWLVRSGTVCMISWNVAFKRKAISASVNFLSGRTQWSSCVATQILSSRLLLFYWVLWPSTTVRSSSFYFVLPYCLGSDAILEGNKWGSVPVDSKKCREDQENGENNLPKFKRIVAWVTESDHNISLKSPPDIWGTPCRQALLRTTLISTVGTRSILMMGSDLSKIAGQWMRCNSMDHCLQTLQKGRSLVLRNDKFKRHRLKTVSCLLNNLLHIVSRQRPTDW